MIKIVTDSSPLYTIEEGRAIGVEAIPLCVSIGDFHYRDLQVDMNKFYKQISDGGIPTSSQPPIGDVLDVYERYKDFEIINICMADGLSGTYQSALGAREMLEQKEHVHVVNSQTLCGPHRYMVSQAQDMVNSGASCETILRYLEKAKETTRSFLIPQDFSFLRRGGRLTPMAATFGTLLKLKPLMLLTADGKRIEKFGVARTLTAAVHSITEYMKKENLGEQHILYVSHANALKDALKMKELFQEHLHLLEIQLLELSPAFVTQGGPQCIALQWIKRREFL